MGAARVFNGILRLEVEGGGGSAHGHLNTVPSIYRVAPPKSGYSHSDSNETQQRGDEEKQAVLSSVL